MVRGGNVDWWVKVTEGEVPGAVVQAEDGLGQAERIMLASGKLHSAVQGGQKTGRAGDGIRPTTRRTFRTRMEKPAFRQESRDRE